MGPPPAALAGRRGPDRIRLQPPDERDGPDRRPPHRHRPGPAHRRRQRQRGHRGAVRPTTSASCRPRPTQLRTLVEGQRRHVRARRPETRSSSPASNAARSASWPPGAGLTLYELSPQEASLEEAFMEMTRDSAEFHADASPREGSRHDRHRRAVARPARPASCPRPTARQLFVAAARAEWTKLRSVRSTMWSLLVTVVLTVGLGALFCRGPGQPRGDRLDRPANSRLRPDRRSASTACSWPSWPSASSACWS